MSADEPLCEKLFFFRVKFRKLRFKSVEFIKTVQILYRVVAVVFYAARVALFDGNISFFGKLRDTRFNSDQFTRGTFRAVKSYR